MTKELYEKAHFIKCRISDVNKTLDTIEKLRKKYVEDKELDLILMNTHGQYLNEISSLEREFNSL